MTRPRRVDHVVRAVAVLAVTALAACGGAASGGGNAVQRGDALFRGRATCATCHGVDLRGTPMGPSLIDPMYGPGRTPDTAIHDAVRSGVSPKNWTFGSMPALGHLSRAEVDDVIAFVRNQQRDAGIR